MPKQERNSLRKRVKRYAKVSSAVAGVGVSIAKARLKDEKNGMRERAAALRLALGGLKGPLMKIAQIMATIPDMVPPEYAAELAMLQADAPPMGWPFVKRRMTAELGPSWEKKFRNFEKEAAFAASLGQVHRAVSVDGLILACKLQYPDMASVVEADLKQLKIILALFERYDRAVSTKEVQAELRDRLYEELDYEFEAKHMKLYGRMLADVSGVHVPKVVDSLSTDRLLAMEWLDGERFLSAVQTRKQSDRNAIAINMFHAWYVPFYRYGVIHGDPHPGNYTIRPDNSINLLDFGCVRVFAPDFVEGVITLYRSLLENDDELAVEAYKTWGFADPSKELIKILNIWARFVYAPLLKEGIRPLEETNTGIYGKETASKVHVALRKEGNIVLPREFVLMDRAAIGLGSVFLRLGAKVDWHKTFNALISDFEKKALAERQRKILALHK